MGKLRQYLKVSQIKELPKGDYLVIGDSEQDVVILQSETKMKAALGKNVKVSLPKAFQTNKTQTKSLAIKGVPTDITDKEFHEFLDLNKTNYAKAERLKSKKDGRVLPIFQLEINDPTEAEALLFQNLACQVTSIVYKVEEFRTPGQNCRSKQKCLICGESHSQKGCSNKETRKPKCANCKGPHVASYKGCPKYKKQAFWATCGEQLKIVHSSCKPKLSQPTQNTSDIFFYSRAANKICSKFGRSFKLLNHRYATPVLNRIC